MTVKPYTTTFPSGNASQTWSWAIAMWTPTFTSPPTRNGATPPGFWNCFLGLVEDANEDHDMSKYLNAIEKWDSEF